MSRSPRSRAEARDPRGDARRSRGSGPVRLGVQEQGRPAAAGRGRRFPAEPRRRSARGGPSSVQGERPRRAEARRRGPVLRARVQDHVRPVRRTADLPARLLRRAPQRLARAATPRRIARSGSGESCRCTPTTARTWKPPTRATSSPWWASSTTTGDTICDPDHPVVLEQISFPTP